MGFKRQKELLELSLRRKFRPVQNGPNTRVTPKGSHSISHGVPAHDFGIAMTNFHIKKCHTNMSIALAI